MLTKNGHSGAAVVLTVTLGTFMSSLDINVVNMVLPIMQASFQVNIASIEWVAVAYLLALGATQLTFGRLSDLYGHKKLYVAGFFLFTLSSLACALSSSLEVLIAFRVMQAISAAMMQSSGSPLIVAAVEPKNRGKSLGMMAIAVAVATCLGPALGGLLSSRFGWNSIFLINIPIGMFGSVLSVFSLKNDGKREQSGSFDTLGSILIALSLFFILLPLNLLSRSTVQMPFVAGGLAAGVTSFAAFLFVERKSRAPLLNLSLFRSRVFAGSTFSAMFYYTAQFIMVFLSPYFFQKFYGMSAFASGLMMLPMSAAMMAGASLGGVVSDRYDSRFISSFGLTLMTAGVLCFCFYSAGTPAGLIIFSLVLFGLGAGFFQTPNTSAALGSVPPRYRGVASATLGTMRNTGMVLGEAVCAALISFYMNLAEPSLLAKGYRGNVLWKIAFLPAGHITCAVAAGFAVLAILLSLARGHVRPVTAE